MKIFITGATGFVGKNFLKHLIGRNYQIVLLTRNKSNVDEQDRSRVKIYEGDVGDPKIIDYIVSIEKKFDCVIHLAASLVYFSKKSIIYDANVRGTKNVLELCRKTNALKFIYASSIEASGGAKLKEIPVEISRRPRPISNYGWSKMLAEKEVLRESKDRFDVAILRIGNVYGSGHLNFITFIADSIINRTRVLEFLPYYRDRYIHPVHNNDVANGLLAALDQKNKIAIATLAGEYASIGEIFEIAANLVDRKINKDIEKKFLDKAYLTVRCKYHQIQGGGGDFISYLMAPSYPYIHRAYSTNELNTVFDYSIKYTLTKGMEESILWARKAGLIVY